MLLGAWGSLSEERLQNEAVPLACPQTRTTRAEDRHSRWPAPKKGLFWGYPRPNINGLVPCSRRLINKALFGERPPCPLISEDSLHLAEMLLGDILGDKDLANLAPSRSPYLLNWLKPESVRRPLSVVRWFHIANQLEQGNISRWN